MKNVLVYIDYLDNLALEAIRTELNKGNLVNIIICDNSIGICKANYGASKATCKLCTHVIKGKVKDFENNLNVRIYYMNDLIRKEIFEIADRQKFQFSSVKELKDIKYKGVDLGYAAFSTYVSVTRNIMPTFNDYMKKFISHLLVSEVKLVEVLLHLLSEITIDLIIVHNGRHSNLKPFYHIAALNNIEFLITERRRNSKGEDLINNFVGIAPHSSQAIYDKMLVEWGEGGVEKEKISYDFFYNKRYGKYAGDKIYTSKQVDLMLPEGFDTSITNIAVYNSSEDEYYSLSKEYDDSGLYPNQYSALVALFEHYKDNKTIHFYLRIHPNLGEVPYKSHTMLYDLKYDNVTIIHPYSSISSYALMDACDKIVVFNSTMGVESSYWEKPVIALNHSYYCYMGIVHVPNTEKDFFDMLSNPDLKPLKNDNCLKAGYYYMGGNAHKLKYYPTTKRRYTYGPIIIEEFSLFTLFKSKFLLAVIQKILRIAGHVGIIGKFDHIAKNTQ